MKYDKSRMNLMTFALGEDYLNGTVNIEKSFMLAKECGLTSVDVMNLEIEEIPSYLEAMKNTKINIFCYIACVSFFEEEDIVIRELEKSIYIADKLGVEFLMLVPGGMKDFLMAKNLEREVVIEKIKNGFKKAVELNKNHQFSICFETTPRKELHLSSAEDCNQMLESVPDLRFVFDTANMLPVGENPMEAYEKLKDKIAYVHLKDVSLKEVDAVLPEMELSEDGRHMRCTAWDKGVIPISELYQKMIENGYQGKFAIEYVPFPSQNRTFAEHLISLEEYF